MRDQQTPGRGRPAQCTDLKAAAEILVHAEGYTVSEIAWAESILPTAAKVRSRCECHEGHWIWNRALSTTGAPTMRVGNTMRPVRLALWEELHGCEIGYGLSSGVRCQVENCVSLECITTMTRSTLMRKVADGGAFRGAERRRKIALAMRARSAVSDEQVAAVRAAELPERDKEAREKLAAELGVSRSAINQWRRNTVRRDFSNPFADLGAK